MTNMSLLPRPSRKLSRLGKYLVLVAATVVALCAANTDAARADAVIGLNKGVSTSQPVPPGGTFNFTFEVSCSSLDEACIEPVFTDELPAEFDYTNLPNSTPTREVNYDPDTRTLTIRFLEALGDVNNDGEPDFGIPAGQTRAFTVGARLPIDTGLLDGTMVENFATVESENAGEDEDNAFVTVQIPLIITPVASKTWAPNSTIAGSDTPSTVTLGIRNASTSVAEVESLSITDTDPDLFNHFDLAGDITVTGFPAGADRAQLFVCTLPIGTACTDADWIAGAITAGPAPATLAVPFPATTSTVTGIRVEFTSSNGDPLPNEPAPGEGKVEFEVTVRDTYRDTGTPLQPESQIHLVNEAVPTIEEATTPDPVIGDPATAGHTIVPNIVQIEVNKTFFSDSNGDYTQDGVAVIDQNSPVSAVIQASNKSPFELSELVIEEPSPTQSDVEFNKFDVTKLDVIFPEGAAEATLVIECREGGPAHTTTLTETTNNINPPAGCTPSKIRVTFTGDDGDPTIAIDATAGLRMHGTLNDLVDNSDTGTGNGVRNCADATGDNPSGEQGDAAAFGCAILPVQQIIRTIGGTKTTGQNSIPPDQNVDFNLLVSNTGNVPLANPTVTDPPDPAAATNPFNLVRIVSATVTANTTSHPVTIQVLDPDVNAWVAYNAADTALLTRARAIRFRLEGPLPPGGQFRPRITVRLRDDVDPNAGLVFQNCAETTVADAPVTNAACSAQTTVDPQDASGSVSKSIAPAVQPRPIPGLAPQTSTVRLTAINNGNLTMKRIVITETSTEFFNGVRITAAPTFQFPSGANRVKLDVCTSVANCENGVFAEGTVQSSTTAVLPAGVSSWADVMGLRVTFTHNSNDYVILPQNAPGSTGACPNANVCFNVTGLDPMRDGEPLPDRLDNSIEAGGETILQDAGTLFSFGTEESHLEFVEGSPRLNITKSPNSVVGPGEPAPFTVTVTNSGTGIVHDPVIIDRLPTGLVLNESFVGNQANHPVSLVVNPPAGAEPPEEVEISLQRDSDGNAIGWRILFPGYEMYPSTTVTVDFQVFLAPGVTAGETLVNRAATSSSDEDLACQVPANSVTDDPTWGEGLFCLASAQITSTPGAAFTARKWVAGDDRFGWYQPNTDTVVPVGDDACPSLDRDGVTYTSYPCIAIVAPGKQFRYLLRVQNAGTLPATWMQVIDRTPAPGDTGTILTGSSRGTEWTERPHLLATPTFNGGGTLSIDYTDANTPCTGSLSSSPDPCPTSAWSPTFDENTQGIRFTVDFGTPLPPAGVAEFTFSMGSPAYQQTGSNYFPVAYNSFAHAEIVNSGTGTMRLSPTEPRKVGVSMLFNDLRITKELVGLDPAGNQDDIGFGFAYECVTDMAGEDDPVEVAAGTGTVSVNEPATIPGLPVDATCRVWETNSRGGVPNYTEENPAEVVIEPGDDADVNLVGLVNNFGDGDVEPGRFTIAKEVTGELGETFGAGPFEIEVTCQFDDDVVNGFPTTVTLADGESESFDVPLGSECSATETTDGGATEVSYSDDSVTVTANEPQLTITVTNEFRATELSILKELTGPGAPGFADRTFRFLVNCSFNGVENAYSETVTARRSDPDESRITAVATGIPVGAVCMVEEIDNGGADTTPPAAGPFTMTEDPGEPITATFTNNFSTGSLTLTKLVDGKWANKLFARNAKFRIQVTCVRDTEDEEGNPIEATLFSTRLTITGAQTLTGEEIAPSAAALPIGARCWAVETDNGGATRSAVSHDESNPAVVTVESPEIAIEAVNTFSGPAPKLKVKKKANTRVARVGQKVRYRIKVRNLSRVVMHQVEVCDKLPANLRYVSSKPPAYRRNGDVCWLIDRLGPKRQRTFTIVTKVLSGSSTAINRAVAGGGGVPKSRVKSSPVRVNTPQLKPGGVTG